MTYRQSLENGLLAFGDMTHALGPQPIFQRMAYYGVPGISLAVIEGGPLAWAQAYGTRLAEDVQPLTPATRLAASITLSLPGFDCVLDV